MHNTGGAPTPADTTRFFAWAAIFDVLLLDQLSKWWLIERMDVAARAPIEVTPFFHLVMVWNTGVSFGMLHGMAPPLLIGGVMLAIVVGLLTWLSRVKERLTGIAIGMVAGGALGNIIDRLRFGAVADFFDFHVEGYHWPAFNIADAAICIGVVLLLYEGWKER